MTLSEAQHHEKNELHRLRHEIRDLMRHHRHVAEEIEGMESAQCAICGERLGWWCSESPDNTCHYFTEVSDDEPTAIVKLLNGLYHVLEDAFNLKNLNHQTTDRCLFCGLPEERL